MSVDQQILVEGHLKSRLLHDFVEAPNSFDDDVVEEIWQHLDVCEGCMEDYEAIREGGFDNKKDPTETAEPTAERSADRIEPNSFAPVEIVDATVKSTAGDDDHINGLMPVGDDPERNGLPDEYRDDKPEAMEIESPSEAASSKENETDDTENPEDPGEPTGESKKDKAPAIEGLITGKITASEEPAEKVETESLAENEVRTSRERIQASLLKEIKPNREPSDETAEEQEIDQNSVDEPEDEAVSDIDTGTESPDMEPRDPEGAIKTPPPAERADEPSAKKPLNQPSKPARPRPPVAAKQEPLEEFFSKVGLFLKRPRNAIICGVAVVAATAAILYFLNVFGPPPKAASPVVGWEPLNIIETRVPLQEVIVRKMRQGKIPAARGLDVTIDFRGINRLVIAVDLDFIKGKTLPHEAIVRNPAGEVVFQEAIPQIYLDDGRFFLRLHPKLFEADQRYTLELAAGSADGSNRVIAQSIFDVLK
jgi:hypothetical protein